MGTIARDPDKNLPPGRTDLRTSGLPIEFFRFPGGGSLAEGPGTDGLR
jgi:hypothetical protein